MFKLNNKNIDIKQIAKSMLSDNIYEKSEALRAFFDNLCPEFSIRNKDMVLLNSSSKSIMTNPKEYARWMINYALDLIQIPRGQILITTDVFKDNYVEITYESVESSSYEDAYVTILTSNKGMVVEINGEVAKVVKNSNGKWNVDFESSLRNKLPLSRSHRIDNYTFTK